MRSLVVVLLTTTLLGACAQMQPAPQSAQNNMGMNAMGQPAMTQPDPMNVPQGMQIVPSTTRDLPAGVTTENLQAAVPPTYVPFNSQPQVQQEAQQQAQNPYNQVVPAPHTQYGVDKPDATAQQSVPSTAPVQSVPQTEQEIAQCQSKTSMPLKISHGITWLTGGTTQAEIEEFKALDNEFNLQILFAAKNGDHLINEAVRILDYHNFELVSARKVGPYVYARVSPGEYTLEVTHEAGQKPVKMKIKVLAKKRLRKTIILK